MGLDRENLVFRLGRRIPILPKLDIVRELKAFLVAANETMLPHHRQVLKENIRQGMEVVDVGANRGLYTLFMESLGAHVHAFEPGLVFGTLSKKTKWKNVTCYNYALGDSNKFVPFYEYQQYKSSISGFEPSPDEPHVNLVRPVFTARLDDFKLKPSFMKIDVEGHEAAVIRGALGTIKKFRPMILAEILPTSSKAFLDRLVKLGYSVLYVDESNVLLRPKEKTEPMTVRAREGHTHPR